MTVMQAALNNFVKLNPLVKEHDEIMAKKGWTHAKKFINEKKKEAAKLWRDDPTLWDSGRMAKFW